MMQTKIKIKKDNHTIFHFRVSGDKILSQNPSVYMCAFCSYHVNIYYAYLIKELKYAGLLERDYPMMCCHCFRIYKDLGFVLCPKCGKGLGTYYRVKEVVVEDSIPSPTTSAEKFYKCETCREKYEPKDKNK